jgi:hypothetical protein
VNQIRLCHLFRVWPLHPPLPRATSILTDTNDSTPELSDKSPPHLSSSTPVIDIHYVMTSVNEWMIFPFSLYESLDHFTYQCPMILEYRHRQMALIQNPTPTSQPVVPVTTPTPSPDVVHIFSPEPEALPTPPWFTDRLYEDFPPNPPNSPVHFPTKSYTRLQFSTLISRYLVYVKQTITTSLRLPYIFITRR